MTLPSSYLLSRTACILAIWDVVSKIEGKPLFLFLPERYGNGMDHKEVFAYVGGGHHYPGKTGDELKPGMQRYPDMGYNEFFAPFGGRADNPPVKESYVGVADVPGIGFEGKSDHIGLSCSLFQRLA